MKMNNELIAKAKQAKSPEELMALAKENGMELTEEAASTYFNQLNPKQASSPTKNSTMWQAADATLMADALRPPAAINASIMLTDSPPMA